MYFFYLFKSNIALETFHFMKYYSKIGIFSGYNLQLLLISTTLYIWALRVFPAWWYGSCAVGVHALGLSPLWLFGKGEPPRSGIAGLGGVSWPPRCCVPRCPEQGVLRHHPERTQLSLAARLSSSALLFPALAVPDALTPLSTVPLLPASRHPAMSPVGWASHAPLAPQAQ